MRYDVSKLAQWDEVFAHAQAIGVHLYIFFNEEENDKDLDGALWAPLVVSTTVK